jgi:hypothetical protein
MSQYIGIAVFTDTSGSDNYSYVAFSSSEADRPINRIKRDIYYRIGFQASYPNDKNTHYGYFNYLLERICALPLNQREDGIKCVIRPNHTINTDYDLIAVNQSYSAQVPASQGQVSIINHMYVQPNLVLDDTFIEEDAIAETESDTNSDDE